MIALRVPDHASPIEPLPIEEAAPPALDYDVIFVEVVSQFLCELTVKVSIAELFSDETILVLNSGEVPAQLGIDRKRLGAPLHLLI